MGNQGAGNVVDAQHLDIGLHAVSVKALLHIVAEGIIELAGLEVRPGGVDAVRVHAEIAGEIRIRTYVAGLIGGVGGICALFRGLVEQAVLSHHVVHVLHAPSCAGW